MFSVIIPVLNQLDLTKQLFGCIAKNTLLPSEIILIDNASEEDYSDLSKKYENLNIRYIKNEKNIGVNAAWNEGIKYSNYKYISILNNDIIIPTTFFEKTEKAFQDPKVGLVVPNTVKERNYNLEDSNKNIIVQNLGKREGWAFTIRKEILNKIDPIPSSLNLFFGDDYLFTCSLIKGYTNIKIMNNYIYHYKNMTIKTEYKEKSENIVLRREREEWEKIKKSLTSGL